MNYSVYTVIRLTTANELCARVSKNDEKSAMYEHTQSYEATHDTTEPGAPFLADP
jgi:hypothetical protein